MRSIKLLLTTNVENLGIVGQTVQVKPGYARNYLLPRGMATTPTPGNIARLAEEHKRAEEEMKIRRANLEALIEKINGHEITILRSANEQGVLFGGVSQHDIADVLRTEGFDIEDRVIRIGEQIKRLDSYMIPVELDNELKGEIKLWVVSDKPADELASDQETEDSEEPESPEQSPTAAQAGPE